jgi:hypothetical protein
VLAIGTTEITMAKWIGRAALQTSKSFSDPVFDFEIEFLKRSAKTAKVKKPLYWKCR